LFSDPFAYFFAKMEEIEAQKHPRLANNHAWNIFTLRNMRSSGSKRKTMRNNEK